MKGLISLSVILAFVVLANSASLEEEYAAGITLECKKKDKPGYNFTRICNLIIKVLKDVKHNDLTMFFGRVQILCFKNIRQTNFLPQKFTLDWFDGKFCMSVNFSLFQTDVCKNEKFTLTEKDFGKSVIFFSM